MMEADPADSIPRQLAERIAAGDAAAFRELFERLHDPLLRFAARFVDESAAEDAVQEAFVRVWHMRESIDEQLSLRALMYRTVRNLAFNAVRDAQTRSRLLADEGTEHLSGRSPMNPEQELDVKEMGQVVQAGIDALPERQREALLLSRFNGLSHQEVAEVMNVSARTVNNHLVRALESLRVHLRHAGVLGHG